MEQTKIRFLKPHKKETILERISINQSDGYYRTGSFISEILWGNTKFLFPLVEISDGVWVFRPVMMSARKYIKDKEIIEKPELPVNFKNISYIETDKSIAAIDIDHAYWRIAYQMGVITKKTYDKGLTIENKGLRLASLANLSSKKEYNIISNGYVTDNKIILKYCPILHRVYNNIRYTCYEYMMEMAALLKDDFICYKTDCIYYTDTVENTKLITEYLDSKGMFYKKLIEA